MQWIVFGILAMVVISGVRRMAREAPSVQTGVQTEKPSSAVKDKPQTVKQVEVRDTVQCPVCHAYMVKNAQSCGREGCSFGK